MATDRIYDEKRGDTLIEVMFAIAVFAMVAIISISMMNSGVAGGERSLELVTARNEINAQAEALRFVHASYTSELVLPSCTTASSGKCRQYEKLWKEIVNNAIDLADYPDGKPPIPQPLNSCQEVYDDQNALLKETNAFILNTRAISSANTDLSKTYISSTNIESDKLFSPATLGARIVYVKDDSEYSESSDDNSAEQMSSNSVLYDEVGHVEGIWDFAVKSEERVGSTPRFYDFYIQSCWYGSNSVAPTSIDTVIRLYNPDYVD